jgi:predicted DNA-binding transcriptional regulator YafY
MYIIAVKNCGRITLSQENDQKESRMDSFLEGLLDSQRALAEAKAVKAARESIEEAIDDLMEQRKDLLEKEAKALGEAADALQDVTTEEMKEGMDKLMAAIEKL